MRFKTFIKKETNEFIVVMSFGEKNATQTFTSSVPTLLPMSATKEGIAEYYHNDAFLEGIDLIEVEVEVKLPETVQDYVEQCIAHTPIECFCKNCVSEYENPNDILNSFRKKDEL